MASSKVHSIGGPSKLKVNADASSSCAATPTAEPASRPTREDGDGGGLDSPHGHSPLPPVVHPGTEQPSAARWTGARRQGSSAV